MRKPHETQQQEHPTGKYLYWPVAPLPPGPVLCRWLLRFSKPLRLHPNNSASSPEKIQTKLAVV